MVIVLMTFEMLIASKRAYNWPFTCLYYYNVVKRKLVQLPSRQMTNKYELIIIK